MSSRERNCVQAPITEVKGARTVASYELRTDRLESIIGTNPHWLFRPLLRFQEAHDTRGGNESPAPVVPSRQRSRNVGDYLSYRDAWVPQTRK